MGTFPSFEPTFNPTATPTEPTTDPTKEPTKNPTDKVRIENDGKSIFLTDLVLIISFLLLLTCCALAFCAHYVWKNKQKMHKKEENLLNNLKQVKLVKSDEHD